MENDIHSSEILKNAKELIQTAEEASKPSRPETDNHETGYWKGSAIIGVFAAFGFAAIAYILANKKD